MSRVCFRCGDPSTTETLSPRRRVVFKDFTDASAQHITGTYCEGCWEQLVEFAGVVSA